MGVTFEEDDEQRLQREIGEEADRKFAERLRIVSAKAAQERMAAKDRIREALEVIEAADGMLLGEVKAEFAIRGTSLVEQRVAAPSLGGQTPANMERIAREIASQERARQADVSARTRWVSSQEETIRQLEAGQSEESKRLIRAQFYAQRGS
jgi:hypothetical protein